MSDKTKDTQAFYRWVDAQGRVHVVSSLDAVPPAARAKAELVTLRGAEETTPLVSGAAWQPEWLSFAAGFAAALVLSFLFRLLPSGWKGVTRVVVALGLAALLTGAYLAAVRRSAGIAGGPLASPSALIQDAKDAVDKMNERQKLQEEELKKVQAEGH